eukprot:TRINITY_DN23709_c0_g2_i1.p1 TRINITY_DN23709_c0_g2~~TRINITY_DN23709_c0_g2_i1.p1  ORF type:complete len:727 (+),score=215.87 TRINITY_DN23709_c0_g2_i1:86-2182(+)
MAAKAAAPAPTAAAHGVSADVLHLVKAQRRVRGTITHVTPEGRCQLTSQYGSFPFDVRSVKPNKNHPDRVPQAGDPCEFRLSHHIPPSAVSIRVAVPKAQRAAAAAAGASEAGSELAEAQWPPAEPRARQQAAPASPLTPPTQPTAAPQLTQHDPSLKHCRGTLEELCGRPMAVLVQRLDLPLSAAVTVLMLHVRALDAIEKSPTLPPAVRSLVLQETVAHLGLSDSFFSDLKGCVGREPDRRLFEGWAHVNSLYSRLTEEQRQVVRDAVQRRGDAMATWQGKDVVTLQEHTDWCRAVGGEAVRGVALLCGDKLQRPLDPAQAAALGTFVEKAAAIQGYLDAEKRPWPQEIWGRMFCSPKELANRSRRAEAVTVLNAMVGDALSHVADAVNFLSMLVDSPAIFCLVAVPLATALADVAQCCSNPRVYTRPVAADQEAVAQIQQMGHPREAAAWLGNALVDCQSRMPYEDLSSYTVSLHVDRALQALRRMDAAAASQGAPVVGGAGSVTRRFLTGQGAALGGKLLYSMLDSLHTVFEAGPPPASVSETFAYNPYEPGMGLLPQQPHLGGSFSSDEGDAEPRSQPPTPAPAFRFPGLSAVANTVSSVTGGFWGLGRRFMGRPGAPRRDAFASFYDGGAAPESGSETASQPGAEPLAEGPEFPPDGLRAPLEGLRARAASVSPARRRHAAEHGAELRSRTP